MIIAILAIILIIVLIRLSRSKKRVNESELTKKELEIEKLKNELKK